MTEHALPEIASPEALRGEALPLITEPPPELIKLRVKSLSFFYGKTQAIFDLDIAIPRNSVTALIGPSGCGKSTLLRTFNRMYDLYSGHRATGEILLDGQNILVEKDIAGLRSRVGMVFQKPTPFPMSIYDNVAFGVRLYHDKSKAEMDQVVESALRRAALWDEGKDNRDCAWRAASLSSPRSFCLMNRHQPWIRSLRRSSKRPLAS